MLKQPLFQQQDLSSVPAIFHIKSREYDSQCLELRFRFNDKYQHIVRDTLGDWIIYYQPMPRAGKRKIRPAGYFAAARVMAIHAADDWPGYLNASLDQYIEFPTPVPFSVRDAFLANPYFEQDMKESDGSVNASLAQQSVRAISDGASRRSCQMKRRRLPRYHRGASLKIHPPRRSARGY